MVKVNIVVKRLYLHTSQNHENAESSWDNETKSLCTDGKQESQSLFPSLILLCF